jgi:hypothetical protein
VLLLAFRIVVMQCDAMPRRLLRLFPLTQKTLRRVANLCHLASVCQRQRQQVKLIMKTGTTVRVASRQRKLFKTDTSTTIVGKSFLFLHCS